MNEAQFRQQLREQGYSEAQPLEYEPNSVKDMHTHDFSVFALVLSGEFTLVPFKGRCQIRSKLLHFRDQVR